MRLTGIGLHALVGQSRAKGSSTVIGGTAGCGGNDEKEWFQGGLAFQCTLCGNCCSGGTGSVRFTDIEADTMASAKKMSLDDFYVKFTRLKGRGNKKYYELIETKSPFGMDCVFLDREAIPGKAICSLYSARPQQCKTWPFWPEIIEDKKSWNDAKSGCPGIGKGTVYPYEFIIDELNKS